MAEIDVITPFTGAQNIAGTGLATGYEICCVVHGSLLVPMLLNDTVADTDRGSEPDQP